jgi:Tol biopolymer transport system component
MTMDGKKAYQLTNTSDQPHTASGVLFPFFSSNGKKLSWTEMTDTANIYNGKQNFGYWVIKTANFRDDDINGPSLANIKVLQPGGVPAFNEAYGWSPDGSKILFASCYNQFWVWDDQIYTMDTTGNNIKQMSSTFKNYPYCEHASYSPDGKYIIWMTNRDCKTGSSKGGDDWWIMNSDSTQQQRLTYFNDTLSSYWTGNTHICCHGSFSPDGKRFLGDVGGSLPLQLDPKQVGSIYVINLSKFIYSASDININKLSCTLYPNPASAFVTVQINNNKNKIHYSLYNHLGSKLTEGNFNISKFNINVSNYPAGVYLLKLSTAEMEINKKVVVTGR